MSLTDQDLTAIRTLVHDELEEPLGAVRRDLDDLGTTMGRELDALVKRIDALTRGTDEFLKKVDTWHQEHVILRARFDRLTARLIQQGIVHEDDLAL